MKTNWQTKKLGEICEVVGGGTPSTSIKKYWDNDYYWVTPKDLGQLDGFEISKTERKISKLGLKDSSAKLLPAGSVILSSRAPIGYVFINTVEMATNQGCRSFICGGSIINKYLYYFLVFNKEYLNKLGTGTTFKEVSGSALKEIEIPLPPLSEQKRIVKILDEAFEKLEKVKENTEKNLRNSKELFESYLQSIFLTNNKDWEEKRFDEICVLQRGFDLPTRLRKEGKFALVSSNGITDRINLSKVRAPGVVTGRSGTIGNVHFIEEDFWPLNTALYIKDFHGNDEKFVFYFLRQFNLKKFSSGAGVPTLNRNNVHSEIVWFPKLIKEQKTLVKKLDQLSEKTQKLELLYKQKLKSVEELKKSILSKAFSKGL